MPRKINLTDFMMQILLTLFFAELVFPPLTAVTNAHIVSLLCMVGWFALSVLKDKSFYLRCPLYVLIACIYILWVIIMPYLFGYPVIGNRYSAILLVPFGYVIYKYHQEHRSMNVIKGAILIAVILSILTALTTLTALIRDPYISRSIKSGGEHSEMLALQGIGGYHFIYYIAIAVPILLQCIMSKQGVKQRMVYGCLLTICVALIIKSNYTTALIMMTASSLILVMFLIFDKSRYQLVLCILCTLFFCVFILLGESLLWELISILPQRVASIFDRSSDVTILEQLAIEFMKDRWPTMQKSINAFLEAPLMGIVISGSLSKSGAFLDGFGQHSHILDTFALFGLFIGIVTIYLSFLPFRKRDRTGDTGLMLAVFTCSVIVYVCNNATNSIAFVISILYPFVRDFVCKKN